MSEMAYAPLFKDLRERAAFATISQLGPRRRALARHLEAALAAEPGQPGALLAPPVFEALFDWAKHDLTLAQMGERGAIHPKLIEAMDQASSERFDKAWKPHKHQAQAWDYLGRDAQGQRKRESVIVSTGTASGKTECFLVPILDDLAREADEVGTLEGVRALFLYPLNALINSQEERLSAWAGGLGGKVRFALYNGNTREDAPIARGAKVPSRSQIRQSPPPILVTNTTMLEYMLVRQQDAPIRSASQGKLRWIVLDEAHTHIGAQAAELALLLRRVMAAFHVTPKDVRFVATSATIGSDQDTDKLRQFLADLAGTTPTRVHVVTGQRQLPALPTPTDESPITPATLDGWSALSEQARFAALRASVPAQKVREALNEKPWRADDLGRVHLGDQPLDQTLRFLDLASGAKQGDAWFLPLRGHLFHRTQKGLWTCINPACTEKSPELTSEAASETGWPYGQVYLSRQVACPCGGAVFPLVHCNTCGESYLAGRQHDEGIVPAEWRAVRGADDEEEAEDEWDDAAQPAADDPPARRHVRLFIASRAVPGGKPPVRSLKAGDTRLVDDAVSVTAAGKRITDDSAPAIRLFPVGEDDEHAKLTCVTCQDGERKDFELFRSPWLGAPFYLRTAIPLLLERQPPTDGAEEEPLAGRRLVTFTDSRQGSAGFAGTMLFEAERNWVRSTVYHTVWREWLSGSQVAADKLRETIATLEAVGNPRLRQIIDGHRAELAALAPKPVKWTDLQAKLASCTTLERLRDHLREQFGAVDIEPTEYAHGALIREFGRRPRRQNSLETLGLVRLVYPNLKHVDARWLWSGTVEAWRDFLAFALDYFVRAHTALVGNPWDQRWLGGRISFNAIVGLKGQTRKNRAYRWPGLDETRTRAHRLESVLAAALGLDWQKTEDRSRIQALCKAAFIDLKKHGILTASDDGLKLDLANQAAFEPVLHGWRCPITRRVLDKTVDGVSPYMRPQHMRKRQCEPVNMPAFPHAFEEDPEVVSAWLSSEPVQQVRRAGVWTELSDRLAHRTPVFLTGEHSAQQPANRLQALEGQFKRGAVNLLSCSTTMEMGVDIGGLNAVTMNNAPPGPANFLQRAGRAGRRGANRAVTLTLCKADPHGRMVFRRPEWPFTTKVAVPRVALDSARIVQRHVNALVFGAWLNAEVDAEATKLEAQWLFWSDEDELRATWGQCHDWLQGEAQQSPKLARDLRYLVRGSALEAWSAVDLFEAAATELKGAAERWLAAARPLWDQLEALGGPLKPKEQAEPARKALDLQWKRVAEEYLLGTLGDLGFLPAHGFPTGVVPFVHLTAELWKAEKRAKDEGRQEERGRRRQFASRDLPMAIREYAPGNAVILDGWRYPVGGLTLNWKIPPNANAVREVQDLRVAWRCRSCGASAVERKRPAACPQCGADGKQKPRCFETLRPGGFAVDLMAKADRNFSEKQFVPPIPPWVSAGQARWRALPDPAFGRLRHDPDGRLFFYTEGAYGQGFALCLTCGRAASEPSRDADEGDLPLDDRPPFDDVDGLHWPLRAGRKGQARCPGSSKGERSFSIKRHLRLGAEWRTDVFELELRDQHGGWIADATTCLSLAVALRTGLAQAIGVEASEIGYATRCGQEAGEGTRAIVLYDRAEGGAGFVAQALDRLDEVFENAGRILECDPQKPCDRACERCLLNFETQHDAGHLDRTQAVQALNWAKRGLGLAQGRQQAGAKAELRPLDQVLLHAAGLQAERLQVFLPASEDWLLADWPAYSRLGQLACPVELIVTGDLACVPKEIRWQLGGLKGVTVSRRPDHPKVTSDFVLAQVFGGRAPAAWSGQALRAAVPGPGWGVCSVVRRPVMPLDAGQPVEPEWLSPPGAARARIIELTQPQMSGPLQTFGERFWQSLRAKAPALEEALATDRVTGIEYSDRYLRSPQTAALLFQVMRHVAGPCQPELRVSTVAAGWHAGGQRHCHHDWRSAEDQRGVLQTLLGGIGPAQVDLVDHPRKRPHARRLTLRFAHGATVTLWPDHGLGAFRTRGSQGYDFAKEVHHQAQDLAQADWAIVVKDDPTRVVVERG